MGVLTKRVVLVSLAVGLSGAWDAALARTLSDRLQDLVPVPAGGIATDDGSVTVPGPALQTIENAIASVTTDSIKHIAIRGIDFPVVATVPGFSYVYNPTLQSIERSTQLGPVFSERAETLGKGHFQLGGSYLYANLDQVDGDDLGLITGSSAIAFDQATGTATFVDSRVRYDEFSIEHHIFNFSATYGITDRWDANVLVPLMYTQLNVRAGQQYALTSCSIANCTGTLQTLGATAERRVHTSGDAFGVGDLLVRTKYRFLDGPVNVASVLTVRVPTGSEEDFQGLGDTALTPSIVAATQLGSRVSLYGNFGFEINADNTDRNRVRYALGGAFQVIDRLAVLVDVIGSSSFVDDKFETRSGNAQVVKNADGSSPNGFNLEPADFTYSIARSDVVDVAVGAKMSLGAGATAFLGAIVPVTSDGIRAEVIPTGGIEVGF